MWDFLLWIFYHVPFWVQAMILLGIFGIADVAVGMLFGWDMAKKLAWPLVAVIGALALLTRSRQQGYADRLRQEDKAKHDAETKVDEIRKDTEGESDAELGKDIDRWTRP